MPIITKGAFKDTVKRLREDDSALTVLTLNEEFKTEEMGDAAVAILSESLQYNTTLEWLDLQHCNIGRKGATSLAGLFIQNSGSSIKTLNLHGNKIGPAGAESLSKVLLANHSLERLYLSDNDIGDDGAVTLAGALRTSTSLRRLYLYKDKIGDVGAAALAEGIKANSHIKELNLSFNEINDEGKLSPFLYAL